MKVSKLIVVGVSYSGFANAELVASQPRLHPAALIMIDSYLDLAARFDALPLTTRRGPRSCRPSAGRRIRSRAPTRQRSPSHHLATLAADMRAGMRFIDIWSLAPSEVQEFRGATCSEDASARWLGQLATVAGHPVAGYVTQLQHAHALWNHGRSVLRLAGIGHGSTAAAGAPRAVPAGRGAAREQLLQFQPGQLETTENGSCCVVRLPAVVETATVTV